LVGCRPEVGRVVDMAVPMAVEDEMSKQLKQLLLPTHEKKQVKIDYSFVFT
jgi:hypothetical protein